MQLIGSSLHLVTWMDSTSWSCTTAGSHDSRNQSPMCRLPDAVPPCMPNHNLLVPEHSQPSSAPKAVPEAGEEEDSYQPGRYGNVSWRGREQNHGVAQPLPFTEVDRTSYPAKGKNNRHIAGNLANVASSERYLLCKTTLTNFRPVVLEAQLMYPLHG